jgi:hypothetical protein
MRTKEYIEFIEQFVNCWHKLAKQNTQNPIQIEWDFACLLIGKISIGIDFKH